MSKGGLSLHHHLQADMGMMTRSGGRSEGKEDRWMTALETALHYIVKWIK
jgi:hypothetical protein